MIYNASLQQAVKVCHRSLWRYLLYLQRVLSRWDISDIARYFCFVGDILLYRLCCRGQSRASRADPNEWMSKKKKYNNNNKPNSDFYIKVFRAIWCEGVRLLTMMSLCENGFEHSTHFNCKADLAFIFSLTYLSRQFLQKKCEQFCQQRTNKKLFEIKIFKNNPLLYFGGEIIQVCLLQDIEDAGSGAFDRTPDIRNSPVPLAWPFASSPPLKAVVNTFAWPFLALLSLLLQKWEVKVQILDRWQFLTMFSKSFRLQAKWVWVSMCELHYRCCCCGIEEIVVITN